MEAYKYCMEIDSNDLNSASSDQFPDCFFRPTATATNWDNSDPFESALSSIVSSPATATNSAAPDGFTIRELIGRLGNICNNDNNSAAASATNSCYATPLNSPPKLNLSLPPKLQQPSPLPPAILAPFSGDPGFAERAAKNSLFGAGHLRLADPRAGRSLGAETAAEFGDSREGSSVSDQITPAENDGSGNGNARKRKSTQRGRAAATALPSTKQTATATATVKAAVAVEDEEPKRSKRDGASSASGSGSSGGNDQKQTKQTKESAKPPEAPKDYIHVRARRGQATDSHSLAERVRREKISERMKFLQDLVPGCNKVTGKAVMLDEIINYVQSLQRQVEFLSMKLSTVNPRMDFNMEALLSKEIFQSRGTSPHGVYPLEGSTLPSFQFGYQQHQTQQLAQLHNAISHGDHTHSHFHLNPQPIHRTTTPIQLPSMDGFPDSTHQVSSFFEDDLQSVVQMGFGQIQQQTFQGSLGSTQMKVEL